MSITGRVLLRLEKSVKIPEAAFDVVIGWHFLKAHLYKDLSELASHLQCNKHLIAHTGMQVCYA